MIIDFDVDISDYFYHCIISGNLVSIHKYSHNSNKYKSVSFTSLDKNGKIIFSSAFSKEEVDIITDVFDKLKRLKVFW